MKVTAEVQRSGDWWAIEVPEVPGVFTQAKRLEHVASTVADAVATMLDDVEADDVEVAIQPVFPGGAGKHLAAALLLVEEAKAIQAAASSAIRATVAELHGELDLSYRDIGLLLGVTHQRVSQLMAHDAQRDEEAAAAHIDVARSVRAYNALVVAHNLDHDPGAARCLADHGFGDDWKVSVNAISSGAIIGRAVTFFRDGHEVEHAIGDKVVVGPR